MSELTTQEKLAHMLNFLEPWKAKGGLDGRDLCDFINALKKEAVDIGIDFGFSETSNANLVLYSDYPWTTVDTFCLGSGGDFYYVSQTEAGQILFNKKFLKDLVDTIGERDLATLVIEGKRPNGLPRVTHVPIEGTPGVDVLDNFWCEKLVIEALKDGKDVIVGVGNAVTADSVFAQTEYETFLKHAGDEQRLIIVDDLQAITKENGVVHAVPKNVQFSATARDIRLLPDEPTTRMIFDEWGHLNFLQKLQAKQAVSVYMDVLDVVDGFKLTSDDEMRLLYDEWDQFNQEYKLRLKLKDTALNNPQIMVELNLSLAKAQVKIKLLRASQSAGVWIKGLLTSKGFRKALNRFGWVVGVVASLLDFCDLYAKTAEVWEVYGEEEARKFFAEEATRLGFGTVISAASGFAAGVAVVGLGLTATVGGAVVGFALVIAAGAIGYWIGEQAGAEMYDLCGDGIMNITNDVFDLIWADGLYIYQKEWKQNICPHPYLNEEVRQDVFEFSQDLQIADGTEHIFQDQENIFWALYGWLCGLPFVEDITYDYDFTPFAPPKGFHIAAKMKDAETYWHFTVKPLEDNVGHEFLWLGRKVTYGFRLYIGLSGAPTNESWMDDPMVFSQNKDDSKYYSTVLEVRTDVKLVDLPEKDLEKTLMKYHADYDFTLECTHGEHFVYWRGYFEKKVTYFQDVGVRAAIIIDYERVKENDWFCLMSDGRYYDDAWYERGKKAFFRFSNNGITEPIARAMHGIEDENENLLALTPALIVVCFTAETQEFAEIGKNSQILKKDKKGENGEDTIYTAQSCVGNLAMWYLPTLSDKN